MGGKTISKARHQAINNTLPSHFLSLVCTTPIKFYYDTCKTCGIVTFIPVTIVNTCHAELNNIINSIIALNRYIVVM